MAHPFIKCLEDAVAAKKLKPSQFEKAQARFEGLQEEYVIDGMDPLTAARKAADDVTTQYEIENREVKRRKVLNIHANVRMWRDVQSYTGKNKAKAWRGFIDTDDAAPYESYAALRDSYKGLLHDEMDVVIDQFRNRFAGVYRPTRDMEDMLREIFGHNTGNQNAKQLAQAWEKAQKRAQQLFRANGGSVRELPNWRITQAQDYLKLQRIGRDEWVNDHLDALDWNQTRRSDGRRLRTRDEKKAFLEKAYDTLLTDGANKLDISSPKFNKGFSNKLENHRVLHYSGPEQWMSIHKKYGTGNIFDVMFQHIDDMSHEIAMMHRFGPSPSSAFQNLSQMIQKVANNAGEAQDQIRSLQAAADVLNREAGLARTNRIGNTLAGTRNLLTAALLGSASLIAVPSDLNLATMAKHFNKLDDMKFMSRYLKLMNPADDKDRRLAIRLGLIAQNVSAQMYGARRAIGGPREGPSWTRRIADTSLNLSLLSPHTQAARWAFGMEMLGLLADNAGKRFDDLPFKAMLERHAITAADWDKLRAVPKYVEDGAEFLRPDDILRHYGDKRENLLLMGKWKAMVLDESSIAVPDVNLLSRNALVRDTDPGTFPGEIARSAAMFKNFPVTFMTVIARRYLTTAMKEKGGAAAAAWTSYMFLSLTAIGALRLQMSNIANGDDPQPMFDHKFMMRAILTGGGLGIMGDFILADYNRFGGGPITALAGPVAQFGEDTVKLTWGNVQQLMDGDDPKFLKELTEYGQRYSPASRLWWGRMLMNRMIWDQLLKLSDPKGAKKLMQRRAKRRQKEFGIESWWKPGDNAPARAPDLGRAFSVPE